MNTLFTWLVVSTLTVTAIPRRDSPRFDYVSKGIYRVVNPFDVPIKVVFYCGPEWLPVEFSITANLTTDVTISDEEGQQLLGCFPYRWEKVSAPAPKPAAPKVGPK